MPLYLGDKLISGRSRPIDSEPIENSLNLVASGGVKKYVDDKLASGTISGSGIAIQPEEPSDTDVWIDLDDDETGELGIVTSFNGRDGEVVPKTGDYTAEMVGADASGSAASALASAKTYADGIKPTKTSQLTNDSGFITEYTETDPTVPAWAKEPSKPTYTASEVGAAPDGFGLGKATSGDFYDNPDGITKTGFYRINQGTPTISASVVWWYGYHIEMAGSDFDAYQFFTSEKLNSSIQRTRTGGVWGEWEWLNPRMALGVEYRTAERIGGKSVYKKNVNGVIQYRLDGETEWKSYGTALGAAPAGYGYGGVIPLISCSALGYTTWAEVEAKLTEYVNILKAGESMQLRISFYPITATGEVYLCTLFRHDNSIYANLSGESYTGERFNKSMYANVWNPIVWLTPPLQFGTADVTAGSASPYPDGTLYVVIE